jgi:hypothetical protein
MMFDDVAHHWYTACSLDEFQAAGVFAARSVRARSCIGRLYTCSSQEHPVLRIGMPDSELTSEAHQTTHYRSSLIQADRLCASLAQPVIWDDWSSPSVFRGRPPQSPPPTFVCVQMTLHVHPAHHFNLAFHWTDTDCFLDAAELQKAIGFLQFHCLHAERAATRLALKGTSPSNSPLSTLQLDLLDFLSRGIPDHLLQVLLCLSAEQCAELKRATFRAMAVSNETEACARASALGLLDNPHAARLT